MPYPLFVKGDQLCLEKSTENTSDSAVIIYSWRRGNIKQKKNIAITGTLSDLKQLKFFRTFKSKIFVKNNDFRD